MIASPKSQMCASPVREMTTFAFREVIVSYRDSTINIFTYAT